MFQDEHESPTKKLNLLFSIPEPLKGSLFPPYFILAIFFLANFVYLFSFTRNLLLVMVVCWY
jgi:hypothetical protein